MTPQQQADGFVAKYNGQYIDEDKSYGSQCWDVVARYAREVHGCSPFPTVSGGAEGLWRLYGDPRSGPISKFFDRVPADQLQPGDIAVWNATFYPPYGHTALVWRREGNTLFLLEQDGSKDPNGDGKADGVAYIAQRIITNKLAGGLRRKGSIMDIFNEGDRTNYLRDHGIQDVGQYKDLVGKVSFKVGVEKMRTDGAWNTNAGDVINFLTPALGQKPSKDDLFFWGNKPFKIFDYDKLLPHLEGMRIEINDLKVKLADAQKGYKQVGTINGQPVYVRE